MNELNEVYVNIMEHSGYKARLMKAQRLVGDRLFGLPAGTPMNVVPIHCLPGCPDGWVREAGSYVCPIDIEQGLWFDWTMNDVNTVIIPSVKGMNPITGEQLKELRMEQYRDKCPKHGIALAHGGFCEKCGYNLSPQNYVAYPNTLWWDGFRQSDGSVRQFFFTEDDKRDIASLVIGKENTVPAFGFAFFKTKVNRVVEKISSRSLYDAMNTPLGCTPQIDWMVHENDSFTSSLTSYKLSCENGSTGPTGTSGISGTCGNKSFSPTKEYSKSKNMKKGLITLQSFESESCDSLTLDDSRGIKDVSVGAGARIDQKLETDKLALEEYIDKPQSLIRLYFVFEEQLKNIVKKGGVKALEDKKGGYLENLPVG